MPGMDADPGCAYQAWQHGIRCKFFSNLQDHLWALDWAGRLAFRDATLIGTAVHDNAIHQGPAFLVGLELLQLVQ